MMKEKGAIEYRAGRLWVLLFTMLTLLTIAASAYAHAALLWCYVEKDRVYVEAFFMGGNKIQNGKIVVVAHSGKQLLEGVTDKEGLFDFVAPVRDDMTIILKIDTGHGSDFQLTKQDFLDAQ